MNKLQAILIIVGVFALAQNEPTAVSVIIGFGCVSGAFLIEYRKYKSNKL